MHRNELNEVYVGIRITGPVAYDVTALILDCVPAVADRSGWGLDSMPDRSAAAGELVWSNLLDGAVLDGLLGEG